MKSWKQTFAIIWSGQLISIMTSFIVSYAVIFWLGMTTQSPKVLTWITLAAFMPQALIGIFAGVYVDRWSRKRVMILADSFIALCTLALFVLMKFGQTDYIYLYILAACRSVGSAFHQPALQACTPMIVPSKELTRAAGINQTIQSLCGIVAPVIGAALITVMSIENILLIDVAGAALAISSLFFVHIPDPEKQDKAPDLWGEIKECFDVIRSRKGLPYIFFCSMIINLAIAPVAVLFPLITVSHFGGDAYQMSIVEMLWGVGAFAGGLVMGARRIKSNYMVLINIVNTILGLYLIVSGVLSPQHFVVFAVITAFGGLCCAVFNALFTAILQKSIDHAVLGRVFSLFFSITMLPSVLGIVGSGFLADTIGISQTFFYSGIMIALMGLVSFLVPSAMRLGNDCRKL